MASPCGEDATFTSLSSSTFEVSVLFAAERIRRIVHVRVQVPLTVTASVAETGATSDGGVGYAAGEGVLRSSMQLVGAARDERQPVAGYFHPCSSQQALASCSAFMASICTPSTTLTSRVRRAGAHLLVRIPWPA